MASYSENYLLLRKKIAELAQSAGRDPQEIQLVAVSKLWPVEAMLNVYQAGCRDFGESRIQEAMEKIPQLGQDIKWHFIGTLQKNKVQKAVQYFDVIHSVDHPALAQKISEASQKQGRTTSILLQVNVSGESTKQGLSPALWHDALQQVDQLPHIRLEGLMTMAPLAATDEEIRGYFKQLRLLREEWQGQLQDPALFKHLSMGMSHDYPLAIMEGATLLRIGSAIFH